MVDTVRLGIRVDKAVIDGEQAALTRVLTSGRRLHLLVGSAGTFNTTWEIWRQ
ncbi:hypothetical protein AA0Y32_02210 [Georgenia phoenicis]|uniref:hypothetical protein n=1 Tax=unclassified Georgenia TaxID=2626815 RepID=UPI0039B07EE0